MFNEEWSGAMEEISKYVGKSHGVSSKPKRENSTRRGHSREPSMEKP